MSERVAGGRLSIFVACTLPEAVKAELRRDCDVVFATEAAPDVPASAQLQASRQPMVMVSVNEPLDAAAIARLPATTRAIATYSVGYEHVDIAAAQARGIAVFNTPDVLTEAVAEVGLFLLLGAARRATESINLVRSRAWGGWNATQLIGIELAGKRLGIFGMGRIGRAVAVRARSFGMSIHYLNRHRLPAELEGGAIFHEDARDMFGQIDALALVAPSSAETRGFLNAERLNWLKPGGLVVNIARGNLIVDNDLIEALMSGHVRAAGLDVFDGEPRLDPRYFDLPNVFMLPHIGSSTIETRLRMGRVLVEGLRLWASGGKPANRLV